MNEQDKVRLHHMLDPARKIRADLVTDEMLAWAAIHGIQIIGEAANQVSAETQAAAPDIPWKNIIGMRHKITHDYFDVDYDIVWKTITKRLPELIAQLDAIISAGQQTDEAE